MPSLHIRAHIDGYVDEATRYEFIVDNQATELALEAAIISAFSEEGVATDVTLIGDAQGGESHCWSNLADGETAPLTDDDIQAILYRVYRRSEYVELDPLEYAPLVFKVNDSGECYELRLSASDLYVSVLNKARWGDPMDKGHTSDALTGAIALHGITHIEYLADEVAELLNCAPVDVPEVMRGIYEDANSSLTTGICNSVTSAELGERGARQEANYTGVVISLLASPELYDPIRSTWSLTGSTSTDQAEHIAKIPLSGKVLATWSSHVSEAAAVLLRLALSCRIRPAAVGRRRSARALDTRTTRPRYTLRSTRNAGRVDCERLPDQAKGVWLNPTASAISCWRLWALRSICLQ